MKADLCLAALKEALLRYGAPEIVNTAPGGQFTSASFMAVVKDCGARHSMDGRGCGRYIVFIERLWRSVEYEEVYLNAYDSVSIKRSSLSRFLTIHNTARSYQAHGELTPDAMYFNELPTAAAAA